VVLPGTNTFAQLEGLATWAVVIFLTGLAFFILIAMFPKPATHLVHKLINRVVPERWRTSLSTISDRFLDGLMSLRSPLSAVMIFLTSIMIWGFETGLYWSVSRSLGLGLNFGQLMLLNGVVNLVLLVPAAPGGLGTFDAAGRAMLETFAIPSETALGFTLILRVALWVPITVLGAVYFVREGLKWTTDVSEMQAQAKTQSDTEMKGDNNEN